MRPTDGVASAAGRADAIKAPCGQGVEKRARLGDEKKSGRVAGLGLSPVSCEKKTREGPGEIVSLEVNWLRATVSLPMYKRRINRKERKEGEQDVIDRCPKHHEGEAV